MSRALRLGPSLLLILCGFPHPVFPQSSQPFTRVELLALRLAGEHQDRMERDVAKRGVGFAVTEDYLNALKASGARQPLIDAVQKVSAGTVVAGEDADARDAQVLPHLLKAATLLPNRAWSEAEMEIRAALAIEPENPLLHVDLSAVLPSSQGEAGWNAAINEDREALRLAPDMALAHLHISIALQQLGNRNGAVTESREVVRLDPDDAHAWNHLAQVLEEVGDLDGATKAYQEAMMRNPNAGFSHRDLAELLQRKGDLDGALAQAREAVRISPNSARGHFLLASILRGQGDRVGAAQETGIATQLEAKNRPPQIRVGGAVMSKKLIYHPKPSYPQEAKRAGIQGPVLVAVVISKDGKVQDMKVVSGPPVLANAAMKAIAKWQYEPSLLSGEPVEVATEINVNFALPK